MSESSDGIEHSYTAWQCTNCGNEVPKHNPPCARCGNMAFEQIEVHEEDFAEEIQGPSTRRLLRDNALTVGTGVGLLAIVAIAVLANAGAFVVSDPVGLGYRYGTVEAVPPDDDGTLTAEEFHGRVAAAHDDTSAQWIGRELRLSYRSSASSRAAVADEIVTIATLYATYVDDGGTAEQLRITVTLESGRARVTVDSADARRFAAGEIDRETYRARIFDRDD